MSIEIVNLSPMRVAAVRHVGPYMAIGAAFDALGRIAGAAGLFARPGAMMIALYHDDPQATPPAALRSDAGVTIRDGDAIPHGLNEARVDGGRFARSVHIGPYDGLPAAWAATMQGFAAAGHRRRPGASFEIYRNTPMDTAPADLVTEIYIPVE